MQIITVLTAHAERGKPGKRPAWALRLYKEGALALAIIRDPKLAARFQAYAFNDRGACVGHAEGELETLSALLDTFIRALRLRWDVHAEGIVRVTPGQPPGPHGGDERKRLGELARLQLAAHALAIT